MTDKARARKEKMLRMEKERVESGEPSNELEAEDQEKRVITRYTASRMYMCRCSRAYS